MAYTPYAQTEPSYTYEEPDYVDERGFFGDLATAFGRGVTQATEIGGEALERIGISNRLDEFSAEMRENYLKQDYSEYYDKEGWFKKNVLMGGMQALPMTLGVLGTAALATTVAPVIGVSAAAAGMVGGAGALATIGAGIDKQSQEEYLAVHPGDYEGAKAYGLKQGASEMLSEGLSDAIPFGLGKVFKYGGGKAGTKAIKDLVGGLTGKEIAKIGAVSYGVEGGTEALNAAYQAYEAEKAGVPTEGVLDSMIATIGPSLFLGTGFAAGTVGLTSAQKAKMRSALQDQNINPVQRLDVVNNISTQLEARVDKETANTWREAATWSVENGVSIPITPDFDTFYDTMEEMRRPDATIDVLNSSPEEIDAFINAKLDHDTTYGDTGTVDVKQKFNEALGKLTDEQMVALPDDFRNQVLEGWLSLKEAKELNVSLKEAKENAQGRIDEAKAQAEALAYAQERNKPGTTEERLKERERTKTKEEAIKKFDEELEGYQPLTPSPVPRTVAGTEYAQTIPDTEQYLEEEAAKEYVREANIPKEEPPAPTATATTADIEAEMGRDTFAGTTPEAGLDETVLVDKRKALGTAGPLLEEPKGTLPPTLPKKARAKMQKDMKKLKQAQRQLKSRQKRKRGGKLSVFEENKFRGAVASSLEALTVPQTHFELAQHKKTLQEKLDAGKDLTEQDMERLVELTTAAETGVVAGPRKTYVSPKPKPKKKKAKVKKPVTQKKLETTAYEGGAENLGITAVEGVEDTVIRAEEGVFEEAEKPEATPEELEGMSTSTKAFVSGDPKAIRQAVTDEMNTRNEEREDYVKNRDGITTWAQAKKNFNLMKKIESIPKFIASYMEAIDPPWGLLSDDRQQIVTYVENALKENPNAKVHTQVRKAMENHPKLTPEDLKAARVRAEEIFRAKGLPQFGTGGFSGIYKELYHKALYETKDFEINLEPTEPGGEIATEASYAETGAKAKEKVIRRKSKMNVPLSEVTSKAYREVAGLDGTKTATELGLSNAELQKHIETSTLMGEQGGDVLLREPTDAELQAELEEELNIEDMTYDDFLDMFEEEDDTPETELREKMEETGGVFDVTHRPDKTQTVKEFVDEMLKGYSENNWFYKQLVTLKPLLDTVLDVPIYTHKLSDLRASGAYYENDHNIGIFTENTWEIHEATLHEIVHAALVTKLNLDPQFMKEVEMLLEDFKGGVMNVNPLLKEAVAYATTSPHEFLSELLSNQTVFEAASEIKTNEGVSIIQKLVDYVLKAFRIKKSNLATQSLAKALEIATTKGDTAKLDRIINMMEMAKEAPGNTPESIARINAKIETAKRRKATIGKGGVYLKTLAEDVADFKGKEQLSPETTLDKMVGWFKSVSEQTRKTIEPVHTTIKKISPKIGELLNRMEFAISRYEAKYATETKDFLQGYKKLNKEDQRILSWLLNNIDTNRDKADEFLKQKGLTEAYAKVEEVLKDIHTRNYKIGLNVYKDKTHYFPRVVRDLTGLQAYLKGHPDEAGAISLITEDKNLTDKEKEDLISSYLSTGRAPSSALRVPGSVKARTIAAITKGMQGYYLPADEAINAHIHESNEAIETRRFIGKTARNKTANEIYRVSKKIEKEKNPEKRKELLAQHDQLALNYDGFSEVATESITALINREAKGLSEDAQRGLVDAIRARLNQKGMHGGWSKVRDAGLIAALGSPMNTLTQLGDFVWTVYKNNPKNTLSAIVKRGNLSAKDFALDAPLKEFQEGGYAKGVDWVLKRTGFKQLDMFAKEVSMQASLNKALGMTPEQFQDAYGELLGDETAQTYKDIVSGDMTENVKFFVFSDISEYQPISLSQMPAHYLQAGNGRIFYTLKSYSIKQFANMRREAFDKIAKGDPAGIKGLMYLGGLLVMANAGVDELKDFFLGKEVAFKDNVHDNFWKMFFMSRYTMANQIEKGKISDMIVGFLTPPGLTLADPLMKDTINVFSGDPTYRSLSSVPLAGKIAYAFTPEGRKKEFENRKKDLYKDVRASVSGDTNISEVRKRINQYNREARKQGLPVIPAKQVRAQLAKARKANK